MRAKVHPRAAPPHEERGAALVRLADEADGRVGRLVIHRLHPLLRERPRVHYALGPIWVRPAMDHAPRAELLRKGLPVGHDHVARVVLVLRLLLGVQVVQVAEELVEAVVGGQHLVLVAQVILAELPGGVAEILEDHRDRRVFHPDAEIRAREAHLGKARAKHALAHDERRAAGRTALLAVVVGEDHPLVGDAIDVGRAVAHQPHRVGADVGLPDIVAPDDQDVGTLLRGGGSGQQQCGQCAEQPRE